MQPSFRFKLIDNSNKPCKQSLVSAMPAGDSDSYNPEDANELGKLMMLAIGHPETKFILAHMGFIHLPELIPSAFGREAALHDNALRLLQSLE